MLLVCQLIIQKERTTTICIKFKERFKRRFTVSFVKEISEMHWLCVVHVGLVCFCGAGAELLYDHHLEQK